MLSGSLSSDDARVVVAGDVTALPAINSWLSPRPPRSRCTTSSRTGARTGGLCRWSRDPGRLSPGSLPDRPRGAAPADAIREFLGDVRPRYGWSAGERDVVRSTKALARQLSRAQWIHGKATG